MKPTLRHFAEALRPRWTLTGCRYPQPAHRPLASDQPGRVFPLGGWPGRCGGRSPRSCGTCCLRASCAPSRGWSSARWATSPRKRRQHRHWPQPIKPAEEAVVIVARTTHGP